MGWSSESTVRAAEEAIAEAGKYSARSEALAALVAAARAAIERGGGAAAAAR